MNALLSPATAVATATANSTSTVTPGALRSRTGKIARLPQAIRQRLNERLTDASRSIGSWPGSMNVKGCGIGCSWREPKVRAVQAQADGKKARVSPGASARTPPTETTIPEACGEPSQAAGPVAAGPE